MINQKNKLSFIPTAGQDYNVVYKRSGLGLIGRISVFLFIVSLAVLAALFGYKKIIVGQIDELSLSIERARASFDSDLILELEKTGASIAIVKNLLDKHLASSNIFKFFEVSTIKDVRYTSFDLIYQPGNPLLKQKSSVSDNVSVKLSGEAKSYTALAQQSEILKEAEGVEDFSFSGFSLTEQGSVSFFLKMTFNPSVIYYDTKKNN